jgi:two-component system, chemotaxis family, chemotaxis protein CheY
LIASGAREPSAQMISSRKTPTRKVILVVDDSRTMRDDIRATLEGEGYVVKEAGDGEEALATIRSNPDLAMVLCDVKMPLSTGLELLDALRKEGRTAALPVVMLTTESELQLVAHAKEAGARGWLVKPVEKRHLISVVRKVAG